MDAYAAGLSALKLRQQVKTALEKDALKKAKSGKIEDICFELGDEPKRPTAIRFCTNDSSYEALGELLRDNPNGLLVERDELVSLLKHLDREEQVVARGFLLSGWSGTQSYSFDRIVEVIFISMRFVSQSWERPSQRAFLSMCGGQTLAALVAMGLFSDLVCLFGLTIQLRGGMWMNFPIPTRAKRRGKFTIVWRSSMCRPR